MFEMKRELYEPPNINSDHTDEEDSSVNATDANNSTTKNENREVYISNLASHIAYSYQACLYEKHNWINLNSVSNIKKHDRSWSANDSSNSSDNVD